MIILAIDTSCDETACAITNGAGVLSNIVWSQASLHAKFGGVYPTLARREHKKKIDWVLEKALQKSGKTIREIDAIAVTVGPGLAISLEVGIEKAKQLHCDYNLPIIPVNHIEAHILSPLAVNKNLHTDINPFPCFGIVASGGNTQLVIAKNYGDYKILATTSDDSLGEALDKAARMLDLGYPGGPILELFAKKGKSSFKLPVPLLGRENEGIYSYSGLKTAFMRIVKPLEKTITKDDVYNLAASFQETAFDHFIRVTRSGIINTLKDEKYILVGGGVAANSLFRSKIRKMAETVGLIPLFPYTKKLTGDNAAMIGVCGFFRREHIIRDSKKIKCLERHPKLDLSTNKVITF